jgi:CheY-like chemotaxis protein
MDTVGKMAGGIAHEFNSIMTAILGQCDMLLEDLPEGSESHSRADEISRAAGRVASLTRQLLAYGRKQMLKPELLDLNKVVEGMSDSLRHVIGRNAQLVFVPAPGLKAIKADAGQIEQVILNIAMNAADAMPNGGRFTVETANLELDSEYAIAIPELKPGSYVMLALSDTGSGMTEEIKSRAFDPFFTTKDVGKGTGLGLATCHGIVKQSQGHISIYSETARGTTVKIYLPQAETLKTSSPRSVLPTQLPRGTETILMVEDDPALREMTASLLRRLGYKVLCAPDGVEALKITNQQDIGHIDLLFTDIVMPQMSGIELSKRTRQVHPDSKILFTSAYTERAIANQGVLDPTIDLLPKPFSPSILAHKIRSVLDMN